MDDRTKYTLTPEEIRENQGGNRWRTVSSFVNAPCLRPSLGTGAVGGLGIFALRYFGSRSLISSATWGAGVFGLTAGASWTVCRRAMYAKIQEEEEALNMRDPRALMKHGEKLKARQAREGFSPVAPRDSD